MKFDMLSKRCDGSVSWSRIKKSLGRQILNSAFASRAIQILGSSRHQTSGLSMLASYLRSVVCSDLDRDGSIVDYLSTKTTAFGSVVIKHKVQSGKAEARRGGIQTSEVGSWMRVLSSLAQPRLAYMPRCGGPFACGYALISPARSKRDQ